MRQAPRLPWPGGDGRFTAQDWDLQVPRSPAGAFPEAAHPLRTCERLHTGWALARELGVSVEAAPWHSFASPRLVFYLSPRLAREWRNGKTGARLCRGWRTHRLTWHTWHPPSDLGLMPLLPALAASPTRPAAAWEPLLWPCISCQVLLNKYPIATQGGSRVPPRFERPRKPGPLHPSWNCYLSPVPMGTLCQPRPLAPCLPGSVAAALAAP